MRRPKKLSMSIQKEYFFLFACTHNLTSISVHAALLFLPQKDRDTPLTVSVLVKREKKKREDGYLLYNLTGDVSHCKKEWLHSPVSFHPSPWGTLPLSPRGQNSHPPGYATLVKYLGTITGLVGKTTSTRGGGGGETERERSGWGG